MDYFASPLSCGEVCSKCIVTVAQWDSQVV